MAYYVKNSDMLEELQTFKETGVISEQLGEFFVKIANGVSRRYNFKNYTYVDEMVSEAITTMCKYACKFDPNVSQNPFAYFTQIADNSCKKILNAEKKQRLIKDYHLAMSPNDMYMSEKRKEDLQKMIEETS